MMRGVTRAAVTSRASATTTGTVRSVVPSALTTQVNLFASNYGDDVGHYKKSYEYNSRSAAHRHPSRKSILQDQRAAAEKAQDEFSTPAPPPSSTATDFDVEVEELPVMRSRKNMYPELYRSKHTEPMEFTSSFNGAETTSGGVGHARSSQASEKMKNTGRHSSALDDTDVTRIYSKEEVTGLDPSHTTTQPDHRGEGDGLQVFSGDANTGGDALAADYDEGDTEDEFEEIRRHPFFTDLLQKVERNMIRFRKETRSSGRYSLEAVNECVRPLLQLTDYPLTAVQLSQLANCISPAVLRSSLRDHSTNRRLQLYRSDDTDLLLDWSVEDFLRRRYESIHISWEPMEVVCRRYGWSPDVMSDRDYLLYFSAFPQLVELAELEVTPQGQPKAIPIHDPVALATQRTIPPTHLLIRRKASADSEPSLTESVRLMGSPAMATPIKGKKAQRMRQHGGDSVADYFGAVESVADEVDGTEDAKLHHAMENVSPLRQASRPAGRTIREFSIPKAIQSGNPTVATAAEAKPLPTPSRTAEFDQKKFEALSNKYHNTKVEISLLRRRLLSTDSVDKAQEMQAQLSTSRRELLQLEHELEHMRELKRTMGLADTVAGFTVPRGRPQYSEAPEHTTVFSKNGGAAEDIDDAEIDQAIRDYNEEEALIAEGRMPPASYRSVVREELELDDEADDAESGLEAAVDAVAEEVEGQKLELHSKAAANSTSTTTTSAATTSNPKPVSRLEELELLREKLSSAAKEAHRHLSITQERRREALASWDQQVSSAESKVESIEQKLEEVVHEESNLKEAAAREEAERKAREVEARLKAQREEQLLILERQRERARVAQMEAARALERQKAAEKEALAMEEELQQKLRDVRAKLRAVQEKEASEVTGVAAPSREGAGEGVAVPGTASAQEALEPEEKTEALLVGQHASETAPSASATAPQSTSSALGSQFMCTPEQYDGLHLAADRLRKEILTLESQMEEEGDEDDETLMAVLAASRADLEELEDCVGSVQANAPWAAERDAKRGMEQLQSAKVADSETARLQVEIDQHRFNISLLEKRLHHTTLRHVIAKLEERIIAARRSISRLRMEQDRLRRSGHDAMGIPASISIAETLAREGKEADDAKFAEEVRRAANDEGCIDEKASAVEENSSSAAEGQLRDAKESGAKPAPLGDAEAQKLQARLEGMVEDIQHLQDSIEAQEQHTDYDDDETESVLVEMKAKLNQLLRLRDEVQKALVGGSGSNTGHTLNTASGQTPTPVLRSPVSAQHRSPVVSTPDANRARDAASRATTVRVLPAHKKVRAATRTTSVYRRR